MDETDDSQQLHREIERAKRLAAAVSDHTTFQRLKAFIDELRQKLQERRAARRSMGAITIRARELWEQAGRPAGRDLEFWLQAESELLNDDHGDP